MSLKKRYECLAKGFNVWSAADAWANGYNAAKGLNCNSPDAVRYRLASDLRDGYTEGLTHYDGFVVVKTVLLTEEEQEIIDQKQKNEKLQIARKEALLSAQKLKKLENENKTNKVIQEDERMVEL